jgi:uncharacterized protein YdcH (DUF465 family)
MKRVSTPDLERRRHSLDQAIHELDRRGSHMTPEDKQRSTELKKQRLATMDQLVSMRRK